jgi:hypothetical protein
MKKFNAYCKFCEKAVDGKIIAISELESGNYLYLGECLICFYEIKRIVPINEKSEAKRERE